MVEGFILDTARGELTFQRWVKGRPEASMLTGVKAKGKECRFVETFRCAECGLLRSYANVEVEPPSMWDT
jgi:hypothetical protein